MRDELEGYFFSLARQYIERAFWRGVAVGFGTAALLAIVTIAAWCL